MATCVRSFSKINLGLGIGPVRGDGFHGLVTLYQTLDVHDLVTVTARRADRTSISLTTNHPRVPVDARNTVWKMVEKCLAKMGVGAEVSIHIEKNLPVQGGMGAGSANAAAALIGLERELGLKLPEGERLALAAEVGSDVPLFLVGGAMLGTGRGELVEAVADLPRTACVVAVPGVGVSTPAAFREWDKRYEVSGMRYEVGGSEGVGVGDGLVVKREPTSQKRDPSTGSGQAVGHPDLLGGLTLSVVPDRLKELSLAYASIFGQKPGTSGIVPDQNPEKKQVDSDEGRMGLRNDLAENILLSLVRTGVENDFEEVVFPEYPSLREIKRLLMGIDSEAPALYAALSGSGSALFGLYRSVADAELAQQRVQQSGVTAFVTETLPRAEYWARMFAG
jgi:4-diphosphocytidyl-2-C-methyl-D-erythritol kinase